MHAQTDTSNAILKACLELPELPALPSVMQKLTPAQQNTLRASLAILHSHRAVLLCEAVGSGKTYIAAALAAVYQHQTGTPCTLTAPASLIAQWKTVLSEFGLTPPCYSYQYASLDKIPAPEAPEVLWLIDEAHYLKNTASKRYQTLRNLTARHRLVLITATPVALGWSDLSALMKLCGYRDAPDAIAHLQHFACAIMPQNRVPALTIDSDIDQDLTITNYQIAPSRIVQELTDQIARIKWPKSPDPAECEHFPLLSSLLMHRLLSHTTACEATLKKLLHYYRHCRHKSSGAFFTPRNFRKFMGLDGTQQLLPFTSLTALAPESEAPAPSEQALIDNVHCLRSALSALRHLAIQDDDKLRQLQQIIDAQPPDRKIIIFTQYTDSAQYICEKLRPRHNVALLTGTLSKLGNYDASPDIIKAMFSPDMPLPEWWPRTGRPEARILICSDAFACGHNFQKASVLIHFDLPWNPTTLHQREGRIIRKGQRNRSVAIYRLTVNHAPDLLMTYQSQLSQSLTRRSNLQNTWLFPPPVQAEAYLFIQQHGIPECWFLHQNRWHPISPSQIALPPAGHRSIETLTLAQAFHTELKRARPALSPYWNLLKTYRHDAQTAHHTTRLVQFLFEMALYPQLENLLPQPPTYDSLQTLIHALSPLKLFPPNIHTRPCIRVTRIALANHHSKAQPS